MPILSRGLPVILTVFLVAPAGAGERRQLDAHEHGHGSLNIAVEGNRVAMELIAPGADIVGFEHVAKTGQQKAAVKKAKADLGKPLNLFVLPSSAGCRVTNTKISLEAEGETEKHEHGHKHDHKHDKDHAGKKAHEEETHSEFHAEYVLNCASPKALVSIDFKYFERFPGAEELDVTLITDKGQNKYEVERDTPRLDLKGIM